MAPLGATVSAGPPTPPPPNNPPATPRHPTGGGPAADPSVARLLNWPALHDAPSAFAPSSSPEADVKFANTRGADKVMYAGYYPMGLSLDRIFRELPEVPLKAEVWPKFLRENSVRVFGLDS